MNWKNFVCSVVCLAGMTCAEAVNYTPENVSASIALKVPGNDAKRYPLTLQQLDNSNFEYQWVAADKLPVVIYQNVEEKDGNQRIVIFMTALDDVYFNFGEQVMTGCFICLDFGIVVTCVLLKKRRLFIPRIAGWFVKTV